jgi:Response regulators consisting of a CheY-like receiver domain and a winged-helix DNA-binding domain
MTNSFRPTILFLDDDVDTRELVKITLEMSGIRVALAETRVETWRIAQDLLFDLYLLDGKLPNGDSFQLCADLKEYSPETPIVFYSGLVTKKDIQRGFDAGASAYLKKPFLGDLAQEIRQLINCISLPQDNVGPEEMDDRSNVISFKSKESQDLYTLKPIEPTC